MKKEIINLNPERKVTLTGYFIEDSAEYQQGMKKPIILVCPGGGYSFLSDREADPIALTFLAAGFHAAVLRYGINEYAVAPGPLRDIAGAVKYLRERADELMIDKDNVYVCGFSAGGHVAAQLGVFWNDAGRLPEYADEFEMIKPNGMILGYPVIDLKASATRLDIGAPVSMDIEKLEFGQIHPDMPREKIFKRYEGADNYLVDFEVAMNAYIFGGEYTEEQEDSYCLQNFVSADTPPAFIYHAAGDGLIYPSNSLDFASALNREGVDYELHIYSGGDHGLATADYITADNIMQYHEPSAKWLELAVNWVNHKSGFKKKVLSF